MKILVISDIHDTLNNVKKLRDIERDITIMLGDFVEFGKPRIETVVSILEELGSQTLTLYVPGNCDPPEATRELNVKNTVNLHGRYHVVDNLVFVGFGGSNPTPFNTPLEFPDDQIGRELSNIINSAIANNILSREELNERLVLVTHAPPRDTALDKITSGAHVGSSSIRQLIESYVPRMSLHGHIHEASGMEMLGKTVALNPGPLAWGRYVIIELTDKKITSIQFRVLA